jgi:hypothetical protein
MIFFAWVKTRFDIVKVRQYQGMEFTRPICSSYQMYQDIEIYIVFLAYVGGKKLSHQHESEAVRGMNLSDVIDLLCNITGVMKPPSYDDAAYPYFSLVSMLV